MKSILFFVLLSSSATYAQTQTEMDASAAATYNKADKDLNRIYQEILKNNVTDTAFTRNLKIAQRLWLQFRDAEMKMKYPDREPGYYGTIFPLCWYAYLTELTEERTKTLKVWVDGEGDEEDDCSGTVPVKQTKR